MSEPNPPTDPSWPFDADRPDSEAFESGLLRRLESEASQHRIADAIRSEATDWAAIFTREGLSPDQEVAIRCFLNVRQMTFLNVMGIRIPKGKKFVRQPDTIEKIWIVGRNNEYERVADQPIARQIGFRGVGLTQVGALLYFKESMDGKRVAYNNPAEDRELLSYSRSFGIANQSAGNKYSEDFVSLAQELITQADQ